VLVASQCKVDIKKMVDGHISPVDLLDKVQELNYLHRVHILEGDPKTTVSHLKAKALQVMNKDKTKRVLIVVDYLQKWASMRPSNKEYRLVVSELSGELRDLSKRLEAPLLAIVSQNRAERGQAKMSSLKETGDLEYDADSIWILTSNSNCDSAGAARSLHLNIVKNRYGDQGKIDVLFQPQFALFTEQAREG
jgi:replicative DNA helicase